MPKVSEFFGISVYIYWADHEPPHFHAIYAESEVVVRIEDSRVLRGGLPPRALGLLIEWTDLHRDALSSAWERATNHLPPGTIPPLT